MPRASGSMSNEIKIMSITYHTPQAPTVTPLQIPTIMEHPSSRARRQRSTPQPPKKIDVIKIRILGSCSYPHIDCSWSVSAVCQVFLAVSESAYHPVPHTQCCAVVPPSPLPDAFTQLPPPHAPPQSASLSQGTLRFPVVPISNPSCPCTVASAAAAKRRVP